ncbi:MAG: rod shape-determining protein RodA [Acidimicrobiia bacterium]|nr:rod shape-determining protein RodA [Acidimicrobiia bacterium]MCY4458517.1 rod shape-determining protein RodA [Acidimicrobiaceae bacterium]
MTSVDTLALKPQPLAKEDDQRWWFVVDPILIVTALLITAIGAVLVFSATRGSATPAEPANYSFLERQAAFIAFGLLLAVFVAHLRVRTLRALLPYAYLALLVLLGGLLVVGENVRGSRAWYSFGSFSVQPSEFGKVVVIAVLAAVLSSEHVNTKRLLAALSLGALPVVLMLAAVFVAQPDVGTILVYVVVVAVMIAMSRARVRAIAVLAVITIAAVVGIFQSDVLAQYQEERLQVFVLSEEALDALGPRAARAAFNVEQSQIAIGNGGLLGRGLFQGTQTRSNLVPEQQTDFIFSVVGEELGFRGAGVLLGLYALMLFRMWRIAVRATDSFDRLLTVGVMAMFLFQAFQSAGMTMGMMPVTGIPLPLVSYGGSSMLTSMLALGLVMGVYKRRFDFAERG